MTPADLDRKDTRLRLSSPPTYEEVSALLTYDPVTGKLWRNGKEAGCVSKGYGYVRVGLCQREYGAHRLAWLLHYREWPIQVDHINGNPADNRIENLRNTTQAENMHNLGMRSDNKTGATGVGFSYGKYRPNIKVNGKKKHLGGFQTLEEAVAVRKRALAEAGFSPDHGFRAAQTSPIQRLRALKDGEAGK